MILYLSNSTDTERFQALLAAGLLSPGNQMQKFNNNLIRGLAKCEDVIALSALQYEEVAADSFEVTSDSVRYIAVRNHPGRLHKVWNVIHLFWKGQKLIRREKPTCILCDAIAMSPCYVSLMLAKLFHIPAVGIVTDLPGMLTEPKDVNAGIGRMRKFDAYVLLTEQMNPVVNPQGKPYVVMEGLCSPENPPLPEKNPEKEILLYTGALWKHDAGIEYFIEGFLQASLPENCELHFYGVGELVPWLQELEKTHPNIRYMGCVPNSEILKKQAEAALLVNPRPSTEEFCKFSFPSKTIEYMLSGVPVLMTRLPGVPPEYWEHVFLMEEETPAGAARALNAFFALSEEARKEKAAGAKNFVRTQKSYLVQSQKVWNFLSDTVCE